ncbi:MAG: TolC family outer membrane protein [Oxalobacteraceae bacterium]
MRTTRLASLIVACLGMNAMHVQALDLLQAYRDAQAFDSQFASARATREANLEKTVQGRAGLLPQVGFTGSVSKIEGHSSQPSDISYQSNTLQLQLQQPLYRPANIAAYEQSKLQVAASETQFEQARSDLTLRVAQAYFDILTTQDALVFIRAQKVAITEQLESAKRNFEVGTATITDTHEAQARFDLAVAQEIAALNDLEVKRNLLAQITGKLPDELQGLRQGIRLSPPDPHNIRQWVESAEVGNFAVVTQGFIAESAKLDIERSRSGHKPTLDAVASYGQNKGLAFAPQLTITTASVGVQFNVPVYAGGATSSQIRQAISSEEKARADLDTARRNAAQSARTAFLGVQNGLSQVRALEAAETSSNSALESNRLGYEVGVRINIDVLNAQQQLYSTRRDLAKARYDTLVNGLRLKAAVGTLSEADIAELNRLLETR